MLHTLEEQNERFGWSRWTYEVLQHGVEHHASSGFIAWPDTSRAWAYHLPAEQVAFLNQFLPPS